MSNPPQAKLDAVQNQSLRIPMNRVGVKDMLHPAVVKQRSGGEQQALTAGTKKRSEVI
ncbi:MAG: hypothetical protein KDI27_04785 [Gammaproteobacteria bacterium]|nr:hypothetical protein [Gammaproteobacteria bacterium]MCP5416374.1 hypothetical protein [Chromatiaceae bacterium]